MRNSVNEPDVLKVFEVIAQTIEGTVWTGEIVGWDNTEGANRREHADF